MIFGKTPVEKAAGAILAHSLADLRKGRVLSVDDCTALAAKGIAEVVVARLQPDDVDENTAALRLAEALVPDPVRAGLRLAPQNTGRVNLVAAGPGIIEIDTAAIAAVNAVDPMITVATVPAWHRSDPAAMVATVKIISYGVAEAALAQTLALAQGAIRLRPPVYRSATLIETHIAGHDAGPKGRAALQGRLDRFGVALDAPCDIAHDAEAIARAVEQARGEVVFILTASATSDIADVAPMGLVLAGGTITRFGMPVDPGNLLFLGEYHGRPVIGLPGCARSPALNGADFVLERVICGASPSAADIGAMGVGGLLKEIPTRPRPRQLPV